MNIDWERVLPAPIMGISIALSVFVLVLVGLMVNEWLSERRQRQAIRNWHRGRK